MDTCLPSNFSGVVCAGIIDHQVFDLVDSRQVVREITYCVWKSLRLIMTWNLDDEFHRWIISLRLRFGRLLVAFHQSDYLSKPELSDSLILFSYKQSRKMKMRIESIPPYHTKTITNSVYPEPNCRVAKLVYDCGKILPTFSRLINSYAKNPHL